MKRIILLIITFVLIVSLYGCGQASKLELIQPTPFYYHNNLDAKENFNDVFVIEMREGVHYQNDHISLLNNYLSGPESESLINPFPSGLYVVSFETKGDTSYIVLSDQIARLSGINLTMACSCLSLTIFELTNSDFVQISAENSLLSEQESILIAQNSLLTSDDTLLSPES